MRRCFTSSLAALALVGQLHAGEETLLSWKGSDLRGWRALNQCRVCPAAAGLSVETLGTDPSIASPEFDLPKPSDDLIVLIRASATHGGMGELFYWRPGDRHAPQELAQPFDWLGDGKVHDYRIRPHWGGSPSVRRLRVDFPAATGASYAVHEISVVREPCTALRPLGVASSRGGVSFTVPPRSRTSWATVEWLREGVPGRPYAWHHFHLIGDGRERRYYFDGSTCGSFDGNGYRDVFRTAWRGKIVQFVVRDAHTNEEVPIRDLVFTDSKPDIPGELVLTAPEKALELNRVGHVVPVEIGLFNPGTLPVSGARETVSGLPDGVRLVGRSASADVAELPGWGSALHRIKLISSRPCSFTLHVAFSGKDIPDVSVDVPVCIRLSLGMPKAADYIPVPRPLPPGKYEIGAYYFCDWVRPSHWMKIWRTDIRRKPALGWYDNSDPEALDWQIKWAVENGISYFLVDWYGFDLVNYFNRAFEKARFRPYMKWALMWCNHVEPGKCREEIWEKLVRGWIERYFKTPEYYRVNGLPYVSIWSPAALDRDNGGEGGCRRMLERARQMAREAGLGGIWFQAMAADSSPEAGRDSHEKCKSMGFDETTNYHYLGTGGRVGEYNVRSYADVAASCGAYWRALAKVPGISVLPNLSTGWDDRPWNDGMSYGGKSPEVFRAICKSAKRFADETGVRRMCLAPLNEWGEGSYAEPNGEFGFAMYEALRETFFERPAGGWPRNHTPQDVGREVGSVQGFDGVVPQPRDRMWR